MAERQFRDSPDQLRLWLKEFVDAQEKTPLDCRHGLYRPASEGPCYAQGSPDNGKAMAIRKSTVLASARRFLHLDAGSSSTSSVPSTKITHACIVLLEALRRRGVSFWS
jgi:hypothetical protein